MANAKYRLTPLKERMVGYLETVGASQVVFEGSFDEATKVANELLQSNTDFLEVQITKIGKTAMASKKVGKVTSQGVFKYGLGGALIFIGLGVAGVMAYNSSKNQAPEGEYKVKLYKKGTLQDTIIFSESYVDKATQDFKKLGYVVRVAKIKTMAEGGGVGILSEGDLVKYNHSPKASVDAKVLKIGGNKIKIEILADYTPFKKRMSDKDDWFGTKTYADPDTFKQTVKRGEAKFVSSEKIEVFDERKMSYYSEDQVFQSKEFNDAFKKYLKNKMAEGGGVGSEVYIEFLNKEKGYKKDIKHFKSYAEAVKWGRENFDNFNSDMIHYKMAKGGGVVTYKNKYNTKYGYDKNESHSLEDIARDTKISTKGLQQIYNKGIGAYNTNPQSVRPNVKSEEQWAMARVYSAVMGGKASKIDENELKMSNGGGVMENIKQKMSEMNIALNTKTGQVYVGGIKPKNRVFKDEKGYYLVEGYGKFMGKKYPIKKHFTPSENEVLDAYMQDKYAKGGGVKTEFDKGMVLNNLDMIKEYSVAIDKMVTENTKLDEWVKMKLTKVEQNMADIKHAIEGFNKYGEGGQIFKKQLLHISKYATDIKKMVSGNAEVMSWIEGKLFVSADYMDTLYHFLDYESGNTASKYRKGGKLGAEYVVYDWDTYNRLSTHKTIESAKKRMYELYKEKKNLHLAVKNIADFEQTKEMLQMKNGGSIEESTKVGLHLPMEISVYVPSTKDANVPVSKAELSARVKEVKQYLATLFGGYSSSEILGGYVSTTGELIQEDVVKVISFATKQAYEENEATLIDKIADWSKEWSQEAIGLEIEGDLYYINQTQETFRNGGSLGGFNYSIGGL